MRRPAVYPPRTACMGGWCSESVRDTCRHYLTEFRGNPFERLCPRGNTEHYLPAEYPGPQERTNTTARSFTPIPSVSDPVKPA